MRVADAKNGGGDLAGGAAEAGAGAHRAEQGDDDGAGVFPAQRDGARATGYGVGGAPTRHVGGRAQERRGDHAAIGDVAGPGGDLRLAPAGRIGDPAALSRARGDVGGLQPWRATGQERDDGGRTSDDGGGGAAYAAGGAERVYPCAARGDGTGGAGVWLSRGAGVWGMDCGAVGACWQAMVCGEEDGYPESPASRLRPLGRKEIDSRSGAAGNSSRG